MGCVNKSSKEFKDLAARHNVSSNTLELLVHTYWLEKGSEEDFPSDSYIQAHLGALPYEETGDNVIKLWKKRYSSPTAYGSFNELQQAIREASRFFPPEAIVYYQNANGSYTMAVRQPTKDIEKAIDDIKYKGYISARTEDLKLKDKQAYTIDDLRSVFDRYNTDRTFKPLADKVFKAATDLGISVFFNDSLPMGKSGAYGNNSIVLSKFYFENSLNNGNKASIILHEVIHALTSYALSDEVTDKPKELQEFKAEVEQLFKELQHNPTLKGEYGVTNVKDFIAELANPIFRQKIQDIDNNRKQSFWQRIIDAFKKLLGIHSSSPYYTRMVNTLDKAINAFDVKTYMEYNDLTKVIKDKQFNVDYNVINNKEQQYGEDKWQKGLLAGGQILRDALREGLGTKQGRYEGNERETSHSSNVRKGIYEESSKQQEALINWAKAHSYLIVEPTDYFNEVFGDSVLHGTESTVWKDSTNNRVIKSITLNHYATPQKLLERILVHNISFPNTAIKLEGIGTSSKGISIIVSQPFIDDSGTTPTYEEIEKYMTETLGFQHNNGTGPNAEYTKNSYLISDVRPENVIKQSDGSLAVIDCFAMIKQESKDNDDLDYNNFIKNQKELNNIKAKAIKDGTFMKAPNGKPTNLNEQQWLQVRTKSFKDWFGDWENDPRNASKVVDENGEPLVVYHGTEKYFNTFSKEKLGSNTKSPSAKKAFFATSNRDMAAISYAGIDDLSNQQIRDLAHTFDIGLTDEDMGLSPEKDYSVEDEIISKYYSSFNNLYSEYKDVLDEAHKIIRTHKDVHVIEINVSEEWVTDKDLTDYRNEGFSISKEQEEEYSNGKTITISKPIVITDEDEITASRRLKTTRAKEFINKYDNLAKKRDAEIEEAKQKADIKMNMHVKPLFLNIKNPKIDSDKGKTYRQERYSVRVQKAIDSKNDGGIIYNTKDPLPANVYYFFEPNQVKSAVYNNGDFSITNDNIDYNTLSTEGIKKEIHDYVDSLPEGAVKSKETLHSFINSLEEKDLTDIYTDIQHNKDDVEKVIGKLRDLYKRDSSNNPTINNKSTALNNNNIITINQNEYTDEFRKLQKGSLELDEDKISQFHRGKRVFTKDEQQRLGGIYERLLSTGNGNRNNKWVDLIGKGNQFKVTQVNGQLFHDIFQINRQYLPNGELVDLNDSYDNAKCYITSDGLQGFAIENNGNLVSVFSLNPAGIEEKKGFLYAIKDFIKEQGATHLDCYNPSDKPLMEIYEKVFGFKPAATMDYNMEYDHDDIAKNHSNPNVVFMVANDGEVENKHFGKDEYDKAVEYQLSSIDPSLKHYDNNPNNQVREVSLPNYEDYNNLESKVAVDADWKVSLLKDLDSRISNDNTEDHNHDIIEQMEEILKAKDKEEYNNGSKKKKDEKIQKRLNGYQVLTTQMNNLIKSTTLKRLPYFQYVTNYWIKLVKHKDISVRGIAC